MKIRARNDEHKNPRRRRKKYMHAKSRFRESPLRFRDRTKICRDQGFSKDHSPPLIKQPLRQPLSICFPCWRRQWLVGANSGPRNRRHPDIRFDDVTVLVKCSEHRLAGRAGVFPLHLIRGCPVASRGASPLGAVMTLDIESRCPVIKTE